MGPLSECLITTLSQRLDFFSLAQLCVNSGKAYINYQLKEHKLGEEVCRGGDRKDKLILSIFQASEL